MLTPVSFADMLICVEKPELGLTKRSLCWKTAKLSKQEAICMAGSPYGSLSMNPLAWAFAGLPAG